MSEPMSKTTTCTVIRYKDPKLGPQRGKVLRTMKLPKELIALLVGGIEDEICITFQHKGVAYSHTLVAHKEDKQRRIKNVEDSMKLSELKQVLKNIINDR